MPGCGSQSQELGYSSWSSVEARTRWINAELQFTEYSRGLGFVEMVVYLTASLRSAPSLVVIRLLVHVASPGVCASTHPSTHPPIYCAIHMSLYRAEYGLYTIYGRSNRLAIHTTNTIRASFASTNRLLAVKTECSVARDTKKLSWCACSDLHLICSFGRRASIWLHASAVEALTACLGRNTDGSQVGLEELSFNELSHKFAVSRLMKNREREQDFISQT